MQTTAKVERKVLSQYITVYQSIIQFSLEKMGLEVIIKHNKEDNDNMLDDINAKLIEVCEKYLEWKKLWLDKFQLATVVMDLYSQAVSELEAPFKVIAKESKSLVQEYLEKNKSKRETLERIKAENEILDKEIEARKKEMKRKRDVEINTVPVEVEPGPTMGVVNEAAPNRPRQQRRKWTDALVDENFKLPI